MASRSPSPAPPAPSNRPLPAHQTKSLAVIDYPLWPQEVTVQILQDNTLPDSTGRTVWLGAQVLSVYLADTLKTERPFRKDGTRKRAIELGAGCGLLSLAMHHLGYDCTATDIPAIVDGVLGHNLSLPANRSRATSPAAPTLEARALDWFAPPESWDFSRPSITPPHPPSTSTASPPLLSPPFDLILTSDTAYDPSLSTPLLRTLHHLALLSGTRPTPVLLALENRDPALIGAFLSSARDDWGFKCSRVENGRLEKLMGEGGMGWAGEDWEGVEVWKLAARRRARGKGTQEAGA